MNVILQVTANFPPFRVASEPGSKFRNPCEIPRTDPVSKRLCHSVGILGRPDLALVGGREDQVQSDMEAPAFEGFPFALVQPDPTRRGTAVNVKRKSVAHPIAE
jgi:hypothetical protein